MEFDITTQDMLVDILNKDGYNVTQATVSRDIKKLGLIKSFEDGVNKYVLKKETETGEHSLIFEKFRSICQNSSEFGDNKVCGRHGKCRLRVY